MASDDDMGAYNEINTHLDFQNEDVKRVPNRTKLFCECIQRDTVFLIAVLRHHRLIFGARH